MKWIYRFFVALGIIFFLILVALTYFVIADPLNLRPLIQSMYQSESSSAISNTATVPGMNENSVIETSGTQPSVVNDTQARALESVGIAPSSVPSQFTSEQIACFVNILGQARVDAIVAGDTPTPVEFYQAKDCI